LIAIVLGAWSGAARSQKAAQLLERGFNSGGLSWLTPSLGTVDALVPVDAAPPNLREQMCGGHRRKPPAEDNNEEEPEDQSVAASGDTGNSQGFMLSSLRAANGKFVLGPPVDTDAPIVVFTGPKDHPDVVQAPAHKTPKAKKATKKKVTTAKKEPAAKTEDTKTKDAKTKDTKSASAKTASAKPHKPAVPSKPKVSAAAQ
jgi:D-alanyl-D-alanine carboxypeptidase